MKKDMDLVKAHRRLLRKHNFDECQNHNNASSNSSLNERESLTDKDQSPCDPGDTWKINSIKIPKKEELPQIKVCVEELANN